jgi:hypothetical protein
MIKLKLSLVAARLGLIKSALDTASTAGKVLCYDGTLPATVGGAITNQVLLATCPLSKPCGTVTDNTFTFDAVTPDLAAAHSGVIGFVRLVDGDGGFVMDGDAGVSGNDVNGNPLNTAFAKFASLSVVAGGKVEINSITLVERS